MFTFNGRDMHRPLTPSKIHLPFHRAIGEILPEKTKTEDDEVSIISPVQIAGSTSNLCS